MKSPAYNKAMDYALAVLKAVKESGYEMDYPLEQFVNVSIRIGANLARAEASMYPENEVEEYKEEAEGNAYRSIYWGDILCHLEEYNRIPFESLRRKCESLHDMSQKEDIEFGNLPGDYDDLA